MESGPEKEIVFSAPCCHATYLGRLSTGGVGFRSMGPATGGLAPVAPSLSLFFLLCEMGMLREGQVPVLLPVLPNPSKSGQGQGEYYEGPPACTAPNSLHTSSAVGC